jgi:hypothetical protein
VVISRLRARTRQKRSPQTKMVAGLMKVKGDPVGS